MSQKIARLSEEVINQIAAGEVVENPSAIVKELIENSLDAGAKRIDIWIEEGGEKSIRIEDDGCGMGQEDALLSLERHATSKIRLESDLTRLMTMGFRGEALAAIAAVTRLEMKTADGSCGTLIAAEGGRISRVEPCARNRGTTLVICDLFFNVPARKKFLKSSSANAATVSRMVETIALAHPDIAFSLTSNGNELLRVFPEDKNKRISTFFPSLVHEVSADGLWGWISAPCDAKINRKGQYLFIHRRPIFSPVISKAVKAGYGTAIAEHSHPSFILFLEVPHDEFDVNIHPQKKEVRFANEGNIFRWVERAVFHAIAKKSPVFERALSFTPAAFSFATEREPSPSPPSLEARPLAFGFTIPERPLAIVNGYFFLQREELLLIDLKAAHARVLYESLQLKTTGLQALMWPLEIMHVEEEMAKELQNLGIECRIIGKKTLAIDALPSFMQADDFFNFFDTWKEGKQLDRSVSCYARGSKRKFTVEEAMSLWTELLKCKETVYCPMGRKIWMPIEADKLKKLLEGT